MYDILKRKRAPAGRMHLIIANRAGPRKGEGGENMAGLSNYEKAVLALTAGFVLFTGAWFWSQNRAQGDYQVTTLPRQQELVPSDGEDGEDDWPDSLLPGETIDLNTADVYELQRLPGIGEKRAQDIVAYREEHGPFETVDELDNVSGIGPGILEGLREYVNVESREGRVESGE